MRRYVNAHPVPIDLERDVDRTGTDERRSFCQGGPCYGMRMDDDPVLADAIERLDRRYGLAAKRRHEPELDTILEEFVGRLRGAFGSLSSVRGKRILDLASGSNTSRHPQTGRRTAVFEPWFSRLLLELGAKPVAIDLGDLADEPFEHHRVDLGRPGALDFLPAASFDGVQDSRLFGSPEFRSAYPGRADRVRVKAEIKRQERRLLRPGGVLIHTDEP